jgi:hypothetical protein
MSDDRLLEEKTLGVEKIFDGHVVHLERAAVRLPNGQDIHAGSGAPRGRGGGGGGGRRRPDRDGAPVAPRPRTRDLGDPAGSWMISAGQARSREARN